MQIKADTQSMKTAIMAAAARAADGDYKTKGTGHEVKDADGDYKPQQIKPATSPATTSSAAVLNALSNLNKGG